MSDSDVLMRFGQRIRQRRQRFKMKITVLARRARLSPNYVSSVELGRRNPSLLALLAIAKGLDMHAGDLLGGASKLSPAGLEAGRLCDALPAPLQARSIALLRALRTGRPGRSSTRG